jgi:hypothetical protein
MARPSPVTVFIFSSPSMTPNQYVAGRPMRHTSSPGAALLTRSSGTMRSRSSGSRCGSQGTPCNSLSVSRRRRSSRVEPMVMCKGKT